MKNRTGFTLIELLVVIAIIGVLASIVLASLNNARVKSRDARRISDIKQLQLALELYFDGGHGTPPGSTEYPDNLSDLVTQGYMAVLPTDPTSGSNYVYDNLTSAEGACSVGTGVCTDYHLGAVLEDSNNTALSNDADETGGFNGNSTDCAGGAGGDRCYDVVP